MLERERWVKREKEGERELPGQAVARCIAFRLTGQRKKKIRDESARGRVDGGETELL